MLREYVTVASCLTFNFNYNIYNNLFIYKFAYFYLKILNIIKKLFNIFKFKLKKAI